MISIIKKFPITSSVLFFVFTMLIPWSLLYPLLCNLSYYWGFVMKYSVTFILSIAITLFIYKRIPFTLKNPSYFKGLFTFGLLGIICAIIAFFSSIQKMDRVTNFIEVFSFVLYIIAVVISEEYLFRGLLLGLLLEKYNKTKNQVLFAVTISSVIFGLRHYINLITMPNTIISTTGQVLFTFMAGFYLSCVYIRSRNIYIGCTIHFLEDLFTMLWLLVSVSFYNNQNVDGDLLNTLGLVAVHSIYVIFGILMIKDKRFEFNNIMEEVK